MLTREDACGKAAGSLSIRREQLIDVEGKGSLVDDSVMGIDQLAIRSEEEGDRCSNASVGGGNLSVTIEEVIEFQPEFLQEFLGIGLVVLDIDAYELYAISILGKCIVEDRGFGAAGQTPGCPDVHYGRFFDRLEMRLELLGGDRRQVRT